MIDECNECRIKDAELKKKSVQVENLSKKHVELSMLMESLAKHIQEVDDECKRLKKLIDSNNNRIEKSIPAEEARVICKYALVKGHGIQFLANLLYGTGMSKHIKNDAITQWRRSVFTAEKVRTIETRQSGLSLPELSDGQLSHLRQEQLVLIRENQKLLEKVAELQLALRAGTRRRIEEADFVELDEESIAKAVFAWRSIIKYRRLMLASDCFGILKKHTLENRQIESGLRHNLESLGNIKEDHSRDAPEINPVDLMNASKSRQDMTEETKSISSRFSTQRASLTVINKLQTQRLNSLAFGFWKLWAVSPSFWASRQPFCSACMEHHATGRHSKYGRSRQDIGTLMHETETMYATQYHGSIPGMGRSGVSSANADGQGGLDPMGVYVAPYIATLPSMRGGGRR